MLATKAGGLTFEEWKKLVNVYTVQYASMETDDFADFDYRKAYDNNQRPSVTAKSAIAAAKKF